MQAVELLARLERSKAGKQRLKIMISSLREGSSLARAVRASRWECPELQAALEWAEASGDPDRTMIALRLISGDLERRHPRARLFIDPETGSGRWSVPAADEWPGPG